jgi:hypothetical protein
MGPKISLILPNSIVERAVALIVSPFLGLLGLACFIGSGRVFGHGGPDWWSKFLDFFFLISLEDLGLSILCFSVLVFLWSLLKLSLAERVLLFCADRVWKAMICFGVGFLICAAIACAFRF